MLLSPLGSSLLLVTWVGLLGLGIWSADAAERVFARKDDGRIVIDEVVGQWLTLLPLVPLGRATAWPWVVTGFVLFRCFDIAKPGPVRWAERRFAGGMGVMMDDVVAGAFGAIVLIVLLVLDGLGAAGGAA